MNRWLERLMGRIAVPNTPDHFIGSTTSLSLGKAVELPRDYLEFMTSYGPGCFRNGTGEVEIWDICSANASEAIETLAIIGSNEREMNNFRETPIHCPVFPEPGGLLPWGCDNQTHYYFWETTTHAADSWRIVVSDCQKFLKLDCRFIEFIAESERSDWSEYLDVLQPVDQVTYLPFSKCRVW